jgi:hypothetical protein
VISPILFNLFIQDIFSQVTGEKVKFADDGSIWHVGRDVSKLVRLMKTDLAVVLQWAREWRLKINAEKTESCLFGRRVADTPRPQVTMGDSPIPYNPTPCLLGVVLDEELKFHQHIDKVEAKANRALSALRAVKNTEMIDTGNFCRYTRQL